MPAMLMLRGEPAAPPQISLRAATAAEADAVAALASPEHAFLRAAWFEAAGEAVRSVLATREDGSAVAAFPFVRPGRLRPAEIAGSYWPFRSFPVSEQATEAELAVCLRSVAFRRAAGPVWRIGPIFANDPTLRRLREAARPGGWAVLERKLGTCFEIDVKALRQAGPWPRGSTLKKIRWHEKGLRALGEVDHASVTGATWRPEHLDAVAQIEARSWLGELGDRADTQFRNQAQRRLWERVAQDPVLAPMLFCSLLRVGGEPAAFTFGLEVGPVRYHIANNYDPRYRQHSPGRILLYKDFQAAAERGVERISWGSGDAGYKSDMGARPGPEILDLLFVRPTLLAPPLRRWWTGSFGS